MSVSSDDFYEPVRRSSSIVSVAKSIRASAASVVSAVEEQIEVGTIGGTVLNTVCNVIGAGVLALPLAAHNASLGWSLILTVVVGFIAAFSAYVLFVGADRTGAYFLNEIFAIAIIGKPKRAVAEESIGFGGGQANRSQSIGDLIIAMPSESEPSTQATAMDASMGRDALFEWDDESEQKKDFQRMVLSMLVDTIVFVNNYLMLAVYSRIIIDSTPPVLSGFLKADGFWVSDILWCVGPAVIFFGLTSVRNFAELKWSSILGVVTILWCAAAIVVNYARFGYQGTGPREMRYFSVGPHFAAAVATLSVAFGYHFNAPSFYRELRDRTPRKMMKTVAIAFPTIAFTYFFVIIFGYLSFGAHVADESVGGVITNNYSSSDVVMNTVRLGLFFHFAAVYPVMSVCVRHSFHRFVLTFAGRREEAVHPEMPARVPRWVIVAEAFLLVSTSSLISFFAPNVGMLINYIGAISGATMMLTVPGIIGLCIWGASYWDPEAEPLLTMQRRKMQPPPHIAHRTLMTVLSGGLVVIGIAGTMAALAATG